MPVETPYQPKSFYTRSCPQRAKNTIDYQKIFKDAFANMDRAQFMDTMVGHFDAKTKKIPKRKLNKKRIDRNDDIDYLFPFDYFDFTNDSKINAAIRREYNDILVRRRKVKTIIFDHFNDETHTFNPTIIGCIPNIPDVIANNGMILTLFIFYCLEKFGGFNEELQKYCYDGLKNSSMSSFIVDNGIIELWKYISSVLDDLD